MCVNLAQNFRQFHLVLEKSFIAKFIVEKKLSTELKTMSKEFCAFSGLINNMLLKLQGEGIVLLLSFMITSEVMPLQLIFSDLVTV